MQICLDCEEDFEGMMRPQIGKNASLIMAEDLSQAPLRAENFQYEQSMQARIHRYGSFPKGTVTHTGNAPQ
jgi:hypothetical protein